MLDRESQRLDLQEVGISQDTIEIGAQGMCAELAVEAGAQTPESTSTIGFDVELLSQLRIDRLNDLPDGVELMLDSVIFINSLSEQRGSGPGRRIILPSSCQMSSTTTYIQRQKPSKSCIIFLSSAVYGLCFVTFPLHNRGLLVN